MIHLLAIMVILFIYYIVKNKDAKIEQMNDAIKNTETIYDIRNKNIYKPNVNAKYELSDMEKML